MKRMSALSVFAVAALVQGTTALSVSAEQDGQDIAEANEIAQACLEDLRQAGAELADQGYWMLGWGQRWGWGGGAVGEQPPEQPGVTGTVPPEQPGVTGTVPTEQVAPGEPMAAPWAGQLMTGAASPRHQIRSLFTAAQTLAYQGDQEG